MQLTPNMVAFAGGVAAVTAVQEQWTLTFSGTWITDETFALNLNDKASGLSYLVGFGDITGEVPTYVFTYKQKIYALCGEKVFMSAIDLPTIFNDPNAAGNGFVTLTNNLGLAENLVSCMTYQGKLDFLTRNSSQIWDVQADPTDWNMIQSLSNIGTRAKDSVQSLGSLDVLFLHDSGIRSLRVRDSSLNAFVEDIGTPIDTLISATLESSTSTQIEAACSVVDTTANRYWLFVKDTLYVLSYYPQSRIVAWSTYTLSGDTAITGNVIRMLQYNGRVYLLTDANEFLTFGGSEGTTYDSVSTVIETPWLNDGQPTTMKQITSIDIAIQGTWLVEIATEFLSEQFVRIGSYTRSTFGYQRLGFTGRGTHFKLRLTSQNDSAAKVSSIVLNYNSEVVR